MTPVIFPAANIKYGGPGCRDLPAWSDGESIVSCWELSEEEKKSIADNGKIWLVVIGGNQPPVALMTEYPIEPKTDWPEEVSE